MVHLQLIDILDNVFPGMHFLPTGDSAVRPIAGDDNDLTEQGEMTGSAGASWSYPGDYFSANTVEFFQQKTLIPDGLRVTDSYAGPPA